MATQSYSSVQSARMFRRIRATKAANETALRVEAAWRFSDPLEQAKTFLRQRGFHVFAHSVVSPGSKLTVVGSRQLDTAEVIAMAERIRG